MLGDVNIRIYTYIYIHTYEYKSKSHTDIINITYRLTKKNENKRYKQKQ